MLSSQQQAVVEQVEAALRSIIVIARAGCGKTYLLIEIVKWLVANTTDEIFLGAFNNAIAGELQAKLKELKIDWKRANASTLHSAGLRAWKYVAQNVKVDGKKMHFVLDDMAENGQHEDAIAKHRIWILDAVSYAKQRAFGVLCSLEDVSEWFSLIEHFGLDESLPEDNGDGHIGIDELIAASIAAYKMSIERDVDIVDFDDMLLAPLIHNVRMWQKDWILLDEAQDTNPVRRALAKKMLKPTGRLIAVGDPAQAIYGFTGADSDALDIIKEELGCIELPLNLTYRCPKSVVALAQTWVPDIQAHKDNPEGIVRSIPFKGVAVPSFVSDADVGEGQVDIPDTELPFWQMETLTRADVILCRNNAPLISTAFSMIRDGIGCRVEGREIGQGLIVLCQKWRIKTLEPLVGRLESYKEREMQKWQAKGKEERAAAIEDKVDTLLVLIERLQSEGKQQISDLVEFIQSLFGNTKPGEKPDVLTLSTVHKSKGREWDRVFLLGRNQYMPSKWAKKPWQKEQEANLCYVAVTRAKKELVEIAV